MIDNEINNLKGNNILLNYALLLLQNNEKQIQPLAMQLEMGV